MKKSNSTSMLSELLSATDLGSRRHEVPKVEGLRGKRNLSTSNASLPGELPLSLPWASPVRRQPLSSPLPLMRINSPTSRQHRVEQLRKEESLDERIREVEQDKEVTSQIQLNQSWSDLKIDDEEIRPEMMETMPIAPPPPLNCLNTGPFISPSSPILASRMRSRSLTPTSPSSSRTFTYRRSLSPVPLRPSSLCFEPQRKRKRNSDQQEEMDLSPTHTHPPKRAMFSSPLRFSPCVSPLSTVCPPLPTSNHTGDSNRPAFETNLHSSLSSAQYPSCNNHFGLSFPSHIHKEPDENIKLLQEQSMESAFSPFRHQCASNGPTHQPPISSKHPINDEGSTFTPLHPVTTIS